MGELGEARRLQEEVLEVRTRVLGPEHPKTLSSKNNLAKTLSAMGEEAEATRLLFEVFELRMRMLGLQNLQTLLADLGSR